MTWSSANSSVDSYRFFESLIPVMSWSCHLVIISSKYILNSVGERGKPWRTPLFISTSFEGLFHTSITSTLDGRDWRYRLRSLYPRVTNPGHHRAGSLQRTHSRSGSFGDVRNLFPPPSPIRKPAPNLCPSCLQCSLCT